MMRRLPVIAIAGMLLLLSACGPRVIPERRMAEIYAEMFLADVWLSDNPKCRTMADTSLFYEPIFRKYGYTTADYDASVRKYLENPEKFGKVLESAATILREKHDEYGAALAEDIAARDFNARLHHFDTIDFKHRLNYEISDKVQIFFRPDSDYFKHPVDSVKSEEHVVKRDSSEVLFNDGPHHAPLKRHRPVRIETGKEIKLAL